MKKTIALLLTLLLLMSLFTGCGKQAEAQPPQESATPTPAEPTETPEPAGEVQTVASPDGSLIFDKDGVTVTTAGLDQDPTSGDVQPIIWVDIANTSDKDAYLGVTGGSVNGVMATALLVEFYEEDGEYYGADYDVEKTIAAGSEQRYALSYYPSSVPGVDMETLSELEFCFTTAEDEYSWYDYVSAPVTIVTGETAAPVDFAALGEVVLDNDVLRLTVGAQDYDDWFGPLVYIYAENKSDRAIGLAAASAEADGALSDNIFYSASVAPGKADAGRMTFDGIISERKGIEELTLNFTLSEAERLDEVQLSDGEPLESVTVKFPPQVWGEYENGGLRFEVKPKYNDLITVETPENDPNGMLFRVFETASLEAADYDGAGWLFSVGKVSEDELHQLLCGDMSGIDAFAKDEENNYYIWYHPTDVRFERSSAEEMESGMAQWSMLCGWAEDAVDSIRENNGLEYVSFSNTVADMYLARAAWDYTGDITLRTNEYSGVDARLVDPTPYVEFALSRFFCALEPEEIDPTFDGGEHLSLAFPEEDAELRFYFGDSGYVEFVMDGGEYEQMCQVVWEDDNVTVAEVMQGWYYACCEAAGLKAKDETLPKFFGTWYEKVAGRGVIEIASALAPGKARVDIRWPESAALVDNWEIVARLDEEGRLVYEDGYWEKRSYDESGENWIEDCDWEQSGSFALADDGKLVWHDDNGDHGGDSTFIR